MMNLTNLNHISIIAVACAGGLIACDGSQINDSTLITLDEPFRARQTLALDDNPLRAEISVNNGPTQTIVVPANQSTVSAAITGVRLNDSNTIVIKWYEILNGYKVEISEQSQGFIADGNTSIDAPHRSSQYDYDGDGTSNLDERNQGTCVWWAAEECLAQGRQDIPQDGFQVETPSPGSQATPGLSGLELNADLTIPQASYQLNSSNADNLINNGDFNSGRELWYTYEANIEVNDGSLCVILPSGSVQQQSVLLIHDAVFDFDNARYLIDFDIRADRQTVAALSISTQGGIALVDQYVYVDQEWQTYKIPYTNSGGNISGVGFGFNALVNSIETTYCFDNIKLYREL